MIKAIIWVMMVKIGVIMVKIGGITSNVGGGNGKMVRLMAQMGSVCPSVCL